MITLLNLLLKIKNNHILKNIILTTLALVSSITLFAQNTFPDAGWVGIGTTEPKAKLHVQNGEYGIKSTFGTTILENNDVQLDLISSLDGTWGSTINFIEGNSSSLNTDIWSIARQTTEGTGDSSLNFNFGTLNSHVNPSKVVFAKDGSIRWGTSGGTLNTDQGASIELRGTGTPYIDFSNDTSSDYDMRIIATGSNLLNITGGNVGIGSNNPDSKLTVNGKIHCKEVQVDLQVPADYVFEKYYDGVSSLKEDYAMPTLAEVEAYTKENHHLPSIPSASEIKEEGLHLKEMTNLLLQKIEELTLYTIEQEKRIKALEGKLTAEK